MDFASDKMFPIQTQGGVLGGIVNLFHKECAVPRKLPNHLKLHTEDSLNESNSAAMEASQSLDLNELLQAFTKATGWRPKYRQGTPHSWLNQAERHDGDPRQPLRRRMELISTAPIDGLLDYDEEDQAVGIVGEEEAWKLLEQIDHLVGRLDEAEAIIERQEAKVAAAVGVTLRDDESAILAAKLNESLQRAAINTHSDAAALYLLDETTSELKMNACYGLPTNKLASAPRPLRGSLADLEALMGNAVLLENTKLAPEWNCPEEFAAAMCLPIGSPTMPHGTLWLWSESVRDFSSEDVETVKAATDKILADIERGVLATEVLKNRSIDREVQSASLVQASRLPDSQPLHLDYEIAGWTFQGDTLGGNFHTWTLNKHRNICAALGSAKTRGVAGSLVASSVQTIVETCWNANHKPSQVMRKVNDVLWQAQDGDWRNSLCYLQIHPDSGSTTLALAGDVQAFLFGSYGYRMLDGTATMLAEQPDTIFRNQQLYLEAGELLVLASADVVAGAGRGGFEQQTLLESIREMQDESVGDIVDTLARQLPITSPEEKLQFDRSLTIIRRRF